MLHELDTALRALVEREIGDDADVEIDFDAPTKDWASHRNRPTIDIYLYDIRQDVTRYQFGHDRAARRRPPGHRPPTEAEVLPHRLPRHGVDAASRGRAPPAVGADVDVPAVRSAAVGAAQRHAQRARLQHPAGRRPAAAAGPGAVGRVVGARRRAEAVARRHPRRPAAAGALRRGRTAGLTSSADPDDRHRHRRPRPAGRAGGAAARRRGPTRSGRRRPPTGSRVAAGQAEPARKRA